MIEKFLKAKHWQLFILTVGVLIIFEIIMISSMVSHINAQMISGNKPDPAFMFRYMKFIPIIAVITTGIMFGWYWSVVIGLQKKLPENVNLNIKRFKIFFFIPLVYMILIMLFMSYLLNNFMNISQPNFMYFSYIPIIIPIHLFSVFCIFYTMYIAAKTIKTVELQREVYFSDFAGEFFMIWFFPIGVWILQPRINRIIKE